VSGGGTGCRSRGAGRDRPGADDPLVQSLAVVKHAQYQIGQHTFGDGEQQAVIQTITQDVSQGWKTPAALAWSSLNASSTVVGAIRAIITVLTKTHGDTNDRAGKGERIGSGNWTYELTRSMLFMLARCPGLYAVPVG
jgi:hypothetical protein